MMMAHIQLNHLFQILFLGVTENIEYYNTNEKSISLEFYPNVDGKNKNGIF